MADHTRFGYADTPDGQVHYAECGAGPAVLCLHQTPRSWDEYREVLPRLGHEHRAVAMDTPGMGASPPSPRGASIAAYARSAAHLLDALGIDRLAVVGHHTGGVIALRLAAEMGERVRALVLSSTPLVDAPAREARRGRAPIDEVEYRDDGSHLGALWNRRAAFYPPDRPDIRERYVRDALRAHDPEEGHRAVAAYRMEDDLPRVTQPALVVAHARDPYAHPEASKLAHVLTNARIETIQAGMVPLEHTAEQFVEIVLRFLREVG